MPASTRRPFWAIFLSLLLIIAVLETSVLLVQRYSSQHQSVSSSSYSYVSAVIPSTPIMGIAPWPTYHDDNNILNQTYFEHAALALTRKQFNVNGRLVSLSDLGYKYVDIDDVWQGYRTPHGLAPASNFPDMPALVKYIHSLGLKIGLYTSAGTVSCVANRPGSGGYEAIDGQEFRRWGIDLLKVDWCGANIALSPSWVETEAEKWRSSLGPNIILSLSTEGRGSPWAWAKADNTANMWRVSHDTQDAWNTLPGSVIQILDNSFAGQSSSSPQHWSDLDFLEVGVHNLTLAESESQFSLWSLVGSPLLMGNDVTQMNGEDIASQVVTNSEVIAVDQDPLVVQGTSLVNNATQNTEIWVKPLTGERYAIVMLNKNTNKSVHMKAVWSRLGISDDEVVRDLWAHKDMGMHGSSYSAEVKPGGVVMIIASPPPVSRFMGAIPPAVLFAVPLQVPAAALTVKGFRMLKNEQAFVDYPAWAGGMLWAKWNRSPGS